MREGWWRWRQFLQVRNLPTSTARSAAMGLAEFKGRARSLGRAGAEPCGEEILSYEWGMFSRGLVFYGESQFNRFLLEDESGNILVDPTGGGVEYRKPAISILTALLGKRYTEIALTRHVEKGLWPNKRYVLRDGDPVYVIGNIEAREDAPPAAADSERLVLRPSPEARREESLMKHLIYPFLKKPRRDIFDVFFISDLPERRAAGLMLRGLFVKIFWGALWTFLSGALVVASLRPIMT